MAGTDWRHMISITDNQGPTIILVRPQLGENIGTTARAMLNCGLMDLRLVNPRDWPSDKALSAASGADIVLEKSQVYSDIPASIADIHYVFALTARSRDQVKPVMTIRQAMHKWQNIAQEGYKSAFVFGPERTGLSNEDLSYCDMVVEIPLNPGFCSLNLAQAVLLVGYEWLSFQQAQDAALPETIPLGDTRWATKAEMTHFLQMLESRLEEGNFWRVPEKRHVIVQKIRNLFQRLPLTQQEVQILFGIIACLSNLELGDADKKSYNDGL